MKQAFYRHPSLPMLELRHGTTCEACYALHTHGEYSLGAVLSGKSCYQYQHQSYRISANDVMLIAPNIPHACNAETCEEWEYLMLYIDSGYWQALCERAGCAPFVNGVPRQDPRLVQRLLLLKQHWSSANASAVTLESLWLDCFEHLCQRYQYHQADAPLAQHSLDRAIAWLHQHLTEPVNLSEWSAQVDLPRHQLLRQFRDKIGMSPHQYLLNQRIQLAKTFLKSGCYISDIAHRLGFSDQSHFQRTFKRYAAVTPKQYQQSNTQHSVTTSPPKCD